MLRPMSKALKPSSLGRIVGLKPDKDENISKVQKVLLAVKEFITDKITYPIEKLYNRYVERIGRSFAFAKIGWLNYDFDATSLFDLMAFKLNRIHFALLNGCAYQNPKDMKALLEAAAICKRLFDENYDDKYGELHEKKWGKLKIKTKPSIYD